MPVSQSGMCRRLRSRAQGAKSDRITMDPWEKTMTLERAPRPLAVVVLAAAAILMTTTAQAQKQYAAGATDTEIKIGNIMPYSGPASAYSAIGKAEAAYFRRINNEGGSNGRKINFISYDDAYSPPKAMEQARKLVESDDVLIGFQPLGTPSNTAIHTYWNLKKGRQIFV